MVTRSADPPRLVIGVPETATHQDDEYAPENERPRSCQQADDEPCRSQDAGAVLYQDHQVDDTGPTISNLGSPERASMSGPPTTEQKRRRRSAFPRRPSGNRERRAIPSGADPGPTEIYRHFLVGPTGTGRSVTGYRSYSAGMGTVSDSVAQLSPPLQDLVAVVEYLNDLGYNVSWGEHAGRWLVLTGDQALFWGSSRQEVEGFMFGMAVDRLLLEVNGEVAPRRSTRLPSIHDLPLSPDGRWPSAPDEDKS